MKRACVLIVLAALGACSGGSGSNTNLGYVEAEWTYVSAPEAGWIVARPAREGARVKAGDMLFQLDQEAQKAGVAEAKGRIAQSAAQARNLDQGARATEIRALRAQQDEAEARLWQARAERDRIMPLVRAGVESASRGEKVEADYRAAAAAAKVARTNVAVARQAARPDERRAASASIGVARAAKASADYRLSQRTVKALAPGSVQETFHRVGEYVTPGQPVLALLEDDALKVRFFVSQAHLPKIKRGNTVKVTADGLEKPLSGTVSYIATTAEYAPPVIYSRDERDKLVFLIEAKVPVGKGLHPGLPVEIHW